MDLNKCCTIDIESNMLLSNMLDFSSLPYKLKDSARLWCVVVTDCETLESVSLVGEEITKEKLYEVLLPYEFIIAHNGIKFDFPALQLFGVFDYEIGNPEQRDKLFGREVTFIDTLVLSRLLHPDKYGGHGLEVWGERLGVLKTDFRGLCIEKGYIDAKAPKGAEFLQYVPEMKSYCEQDTISNVGVFKHLWEQFIAYPGWRQAMRMESKLADLGLRREVFGFWFDRDLAVKCVEELTILMEEHKKKVNPLLPPKPMNKGGLKPFTPPKNQLTKAGALTSHMRKFLERLETEAQVAEDLSMTFEYDGKVFPIPCDNSVKTHTEPDISNLNHVKTHLINLGWDPTEWRERDLTKDAKKVNLSFEKRVKALDTYLAQTLGEGLYKKQRLEILGIPESSLRGSLVERLKGDFPVQVPTSPSVRVGVAKEVCPNLIKVGEKVEFANDFSLYLTYKHRKSSIAGGQLEDVDYDEEYPKSGFLANYRQEDHRIPTPAIEIGATTFRYRHISITNIPRSSSVYGEKMRSLFGPGEGGVQLGFDFSSLEARIQGHYCWNYTDGQKLAKTLLAEKPLDIHTVTGLTLGLPRSDAKSVNYMLIYGGKIPKVKSMLGVDSLRATEIFNLFWDSMPALKELKQAILEHWLENDKKFITGIDGRRVMTRSEHSLLNSAFQSAGVIAAKYVTVFMLQELETLGYNTNPFKGLPDVCSMLEMHDECQLFVKKNIPTFKTFESEEEAEEFVKKWQGEGQLSAISHGKSWYVCLPNPVSLAIGKAIKRTEELLKLNVELGYEWIVSNNWHGCH